MANLTDTAGRGGGNWEIWNFLRRRFNELLGLGGFIASVMVTLMLVTYDPADPSLNVAVDRAPANLGGPIGANIADMLMQYFGLCAYLLPAILGIWSLKLLINQPIKQAWMRLIALPLALMTGAAALGIVPAQGRFGLHNGLGGAVGEIMFGAGNPHAAAASLGAMTPLAAMAAAALSGLLIYLSLGLSRGEWRGVRAGAGKVTKVSKVGTKAVAETVAETGKKVGLSTWAWGRRQFESSARTAPDFSVYRPAREPPIKVRGTRQDPSFGAANEVDDAPPSAGPLPPLGVEAAAARRSIPRDVVMPKTGAPQSKKTEQSRQQTLNLEPQDPCALPDLELLTAAPMVRGSGPSEEALQQNALLLLGVLEDFGVRGEIVKVRPGPVVTLYELEPAPGTKSSRVISLADDIARSMSAVSVRVAVVPGRNVIGIELPNVKSETVYLRELLASDAFERGSSQLTLVLGKDIGGAPVIADLAKMPHLLIAGTTGSGKSVGINTMILSILYRMPPDRCKFIMIDPKMLELSIYDGIPHLLAPVVTDPKKAVMALKWTVREMENRYRLMSKLGVRNIEGYNNRLQEARSKGEELRRRIQTGFDPETGEPQFEDQPLDTRPLPFIVVVVDEMADLMLVAGKDIEAAIQRLAQMARAAGIHIIMATQRPSVDVITGTIKANFPTRISFQVTSKIDSRTILGESGAEQLLGRGDMLHMAGGGRITRVHGPFVSDGEVEAVVNYLKQQAEPDYIEDVTADPESGGGGEIAEGGESDEGSDQLYDKAVDLVCRERKASTSFVQRHLQIGYNRAARIVERMEQEGVVTSANHVGKREVLAPPPR